MASALSRLPVHRWGMVEMVEIVMIYGEDSDGIVWR